MRKILLSMKPYWFEKIMSGEKIYEYRTRFASEELEAYVYVSQPVCAITGLLHLGRKEYLKTWREENYENEELVKRIDAYMERGNKVAMPVLRYQYTNQIGLKELREEVKTFVVPQSYYYLEEEGELLKYINENLIFEGFERCNKINREDIDEKCRDYRNEKRLFR